MKLEFFGYHQLATDNIRLIIGKDGSVMSVDYFADFNGKKSNVNYLPNKAKSINALIGFHPKDQKCNKMTHEQLFEIIELNDLTDEQKQSIKDKSNSYFYNDTTLSLAYLEFFNILENRKLEQDLKLKFRNEFKQELMAEILNERLITNKLPEKRKLKI